MMYKFTMPKPNKVQRINLISETFHPEFEERDVILAEVLYIPLLEKTTRELLEKRYLKNKVYRKLTENIEHLYWSFICADLLTICQKLQSLPTSENITYLQNEIESIKKKNNVEYKIVELTKSINENNINIVNLFEDVINNSLLYNTTELMEIIYEYNNGINDFKYRDNYNNLTEAILNISLLRFIEILQIKLTEIQTGRIFNFPNNKNLKDPQETYSILTIENNNDLKENKEIFKKNTDTENDHYLRSIKDISDFIGCSITTAQKIKNTHKAIFIQTGRKIMVQKEDLLKAIKNKKV